MPEGAPLGNFGTFSSEFVQPQQETDLYLGPGQYSLSTLSTVPYASLTGLGRREKIFSWGEVVEVPANEKARVKNASYHGGDIVINSGRDYSATPHRISVPVKTERLPFNAAAELIAPIYRADTRRARRAFIAGDFSTTDGLAINVITGSVIEGSQGGHSHFTPAQVLALGAYASGTLVGYADVQTIPGSTAAGLLPLGFRANLAPPTYPHSLLDSSFFLVVVNLNATVPALTNAYYVLEY